MSRRQHHGEGEKNYQNLECERLTVTMILNGNPEVRQIATIILI